MRKSSEGGPLLEHLAVDLHGAGRAQVVEQRLALDPAGMGDDEVHVVGQVGDHLADGLGQGLVGRVDALDHDDAAVTEQVGGGRLAQLVRRRRRTRADDGALGGRVGAARRRRHREDRPVDEHRLAADGQGDARDAHGGGSVPWGSVRRQDKADGTLPARPTGRVTAEAGGPGHDPQALPRGDDGHVAVAVGAGDEGAHRRPGGDRLRCRMAVAVVRPHADERDGRTGPRRQQRRLVAGAVVGHLHDVEGPASQVGRDGGLRLGLDVPGQQHATTGHGEREDEAGVVGDRSRLDATARPDHLPGGIAPPLGRRRR